MEWIGCIRCEKFRHDFVGRTFALFEPNATKHYETHQNMISGSNGVDRVHSLRKIRRRLRGMNFCINCTSSAHFAPSLQP